MARKRTTPKVVPVGDYPERPYEEAKADPDEIAAYEDRATVDQIPDYHQTHPTLKPGKAQEAEPPVASPGDAVQ